MGGWIDGYLCAQPTDNTRNADVHAEEAAEVGQQGRTGGAVLPLVLLLVPREVRQVYQQERLHPGMGVEIGALSVWDANPVCEALIGEEHCLTAYCLTK